jgi:hypothetical protein
MNVSAVRTIGVGEIEEIRGCDGCSCSHIDKTDRENKTQEKIER